MQEKASGLPFFYILWETGDNGYQNRAKRKTPRVGVVLSRIVWTVQNWQENIFLYGVVQRKPRHSIFLLDTLVIAEINITAIKTVEMMTRIACVLEKRTYDVII